ncbi:MAG: GAF domain-containing protein [Candidatus Eisenbacteria bacterium]|uniref:GAF domain-containing protein n=1 Tax=Eiseniibacteriota bacterium TaxID=2212470 RepID=A0A538TZ39_UNCEI|nr:MAG: GAF domain-containing protein [Candidatus Eisenbacteria bacterium]
MSLAALEEQTVAATQHLNEAYTQLTDSQSRLEHLEKTMGFLKEVFQVLAQEHDPDDFPRTVVQWFCEHFELGRCSLMLLEGGDETLKIAAQQGIDPDVVDGIRVRVGQGVAGWVAHHKRPLFVRGKEEQAPHTGKDSYNSDSFISVPLTHNNRLFGVLNLSNKRDGEPFEEIDLDRAMMAGALVAMSLGSRDARSESARRGDRRGQRRAVGSAPFSSSARSSASART